MKKTEKFIAFRNKENGTFLVEFKNNGRALAYSAKYTNELRNASKNDVTATRKQIEDFKKLAEAFDCELLEVTATYELETLDGNEPKDLTDEIEKAKRKHFENFLRLLLADNDDEED